MATSENENVLSSLRTFLERKDLEIENLKSLVNELRENVANEEYFQRNSRINNFCQPNGAEPLFLCCDDQCQCNCHKLLKSDTCTQTFESDFQNTDFTNSALDWAPDEGASVTVADLIKEVVDNQPSQNDYVYDEGSKMYYSPSTGYYYDWERNLLYEPYSRTYYKYDEKKNSYEFYYQMDCKNDEMSTTDQVSQKVSGLKLDDASPSYSNDMNTEVYRDPRKQQKLKIDVKLQRNHDLQMGQEVGRQNTEHAFSTAFMKKSNRHLKMKTPCRTDFENVVDQVFNSDSCSSLEDGEIPSSSSSSGDSSFDDIDEASVPKFNDDSLESWPPCIRAIIKESSSQKIGSLFLIPFTGGVIGREKSSGICIPDIAISRAHAKVLFDREAWTYNVTDLGSQNGTFINNVRLNQAEDSCHPLKHGDMLALGSCKMLIHIHRGSSTCNECEPGLVQAELVPNQEKLAVVKTKKDREKERRHNLKQIKKKFGLETVDYINGEKPLEYQNYQDRAEVRRKVVGSQNPYEKDTPAASVDVSVSSSNKGYQMLKKMGWQEGDCIGANDTGILDPISIRYRNTRAGLGSDAVEQVSVPEDPRRERWKKAQKRFHELYEKVDEEDDDY